MKAAPKPGIVVFRENSEGSRNMYHSWGGFMPNEDMVMFSRKAAERLAHEVSKLMEEAILDTLAAGTVTPDMGGKETTASYTDLIVKRISE